MMYPRRVWRVVRIACLALGGWLAVHGAALAQSPAKKDEGGGSYVLSYFLVILGIAFGLLFVCRPSSHRVRPRTDQDAKASSAEEH
jgi:hypothetical protein